MIDFGINKIQMAIIDGAFFVGSLVGISIYVFSNQTKKHPVRYCLYYSLVGCIMYFIVLCFTLRETVYYPCVLLTTLNFFCGLSDGPTYAFGLLILTVSKEKVKKALQNERNQVNESHCLSNSFLERNQTIVLNIWGSCFEAGNFTGLLMCSLLVYNLQLDWRYNLLTAIVLRLMTVSLLFYSMAHWIDEAVSSEQNDSLNSDTQSHDQSYSITVSKYASMFLESPQNKWIIFSYALYGVFIFGNNQVLPVFFFHIGLKGHQGLISAFFNIAILLGTLALPCQMRFIEWILSRGHPERATGYQTVETETASPEIPDSNAVDDETKMNWICLVCLLGFLVCSFLLMLYGLLSISPSSAQTGTGIYIVLFGLVGFAVGTPVNYYFAHQAIKVVSNVETSSIDHHQISSAQIVAQQSEEHSLHFYIKQLTLGLCQVSRLTGLVLFIALSYFLIDQHPHAFLVSNSLIAILLLLAHRKTMTKGSNTY